MFRVPRLVDQILQILEADLASLVLERKVLVDLLARRKLGKLAVGRFKRRLERRRLVLKLVRLGVPLAQLRLQLGQQQLFLGLLLLRNTPRAGG